MDTILNRLTEKKRQLDALGPLAPALHDNLAKWYRVALTYSSNAIEGNTLSMQETACVVDEGLSIAGKTVVEHLEAIGHAEAVDYIRALAISKSRDQIVLEDVLAVHRMVLQKINPAEAGNLRSMMVRISGSQVARPNAAKVADLMHEFVGWLRNTQGHVAQIAAQAHLKFVFIHPFIDGNGRSARLLMNLLLLQQGYPLAIIEAEQRAAYLQAIEKALRFDDRADFERLVYAAVEHSLDAYLEAVRGE